MNCRAGVRLGVRESTNKKPNASNSWENSTDVQVLSRRLSQTYPVCVGVNGPHAYIPTSALRVPFLPDANVTHACMCMGLLDFRPHFSSDELACYSLDALHSLVELFL